MKKCITIFILNLLHVLLNQHETIIIPICDNLEEETYFFKNKRHQFTISTYVI